jgi:type I restriction enzyme S subunit
LKEKRQALISHAVTKGLNPHAKMKPSGIPWLGEIPENWEVRRLKQVALTRFSSVDKHTVEGEQPVRLCNYTDVYYNDTITPALDFMEATATPEEARKFALKKGDVLVTKDSEEWNDIAVSAYVDSNLEGVLCGYHLAQVRGKPDRMDGKYLFRAFSARGINDQFRVEATGITRYGLGKYGLDNGLFPVPPLQEQFSIAAFLDRETGRIDTMIAKVNKSIDLLREYRVALISAAVTGKIDIRSNIGAGFQKN